MNRASIERVREDFDRIARLSSHGWDHNVHSHPELLRRVPRPCGAALEIGCGAGTFTRELSPLVTRVVGIDLSPEMLKVARARCADLTNVELIEADVTTFPLPESAFDLVVTIATLHHLPLETTLERITRTLRPGGRLLVLDLARPQGIGGFLWNLAAVTASRVQMHLHPQRVSRELRRAWREHGAEDVYLTLGEARRLSRTLLPGARVSWRLYWRYLLEWDKRVGRSSDPRQCR